MIPKLITILEKKAGDPGFLASKLGISKSTKQFSGGFSNFRKEVNNNDDVFNPYDWVISGVARALSSGRLGGKVRDIIESMSPYELTILYDELAKKVPDNQDDMARYINKKYS